MPKCSDGTFVIGGLFAFAIWILVVLPFLYEVPNIQHHESSEFWSAKLTDWLLAAFTLALVVFTALLYRATAGLFSETAGLRTTANEQRTDMLRSIAASEQLAIATNKAANAAMTSNQIAVTNAEQQLRAYVTVQEVAMTIHRHPDRIGTYDHSHIPGPSHTYSFSVILKNGGATPAINARININCDKFNSDIPPDFSFPDSALFGNALIGPQTIWHTPNVTVTAEELEKPAIPTAKRYLWGFVEYDDIFSGTLRHRTEFCFQIVFKRLQPTNEPWIGFEPYSRFNAADNDCLRPVDPTTNKSD
jgi:hypothetical protein